MPGLIFSVGGRLDGSVERSLRQFEAEAKASSLRVQSSLRSQITGLDRQLSRADPRSAEASALNIQRTHAEQALLIATNGQYLSAAKQRIAAKQAEGAAAKVSEAEKVAANKAAMDAIIAQERKAGIAAQLEQEAEVAARIEADAEKVASNRLAMDLIIAKEREAGIAAQIEMEMELAARAEQEAAKATGRISGLNMVVRESLVLMRELFRGNTSRIPGSASVLAQGMAQMGPVGKAISFLNKPLFNASAAQAEGAAAGKAVATGFIASLATIPLVAMGLVAGAVVAIIAAPFIYFHRVKALAAELQTQMVSTFNPEHIAKYLSRLEVVNQLEKDIAESARSIQEAHDGVADSIQREMDLMRSRIAFERELLEAKKANELAAVKNPAEREAIEKKYSALLLANRKKERDAELQSMVDQANKLPGEIKGTEAQIKRLTENGYVSPETAAQIQKQREDANNAWAQYRNGTSSGFTRDKDRALVDKDNQAERILGPLTGSQKEERGAAMERLKNADEAQKSLNQWIDGGDARSRSQARVKELSDKVKKDSDELARLNGSAGDNGALHDKAVQNLQQDKQDLALEKARLSRIDAGRPLSGREVTERERVGFGSPTIALLDVNRSMDRKLGVLVQHAQNKQTGGGGALGTGGTPAGFGD